VQGKKVMFAPSPTSTTLPHNKENSHPNHLGADQCGQDEDVCGRATSEENNKFGVSGAHCVVPGCGMCVRACVLVLVHVFFVSEFVGCAR